MKNAITLSNDLNEAQAALNSAQKESNEAERRITNLQFFLEKAEQALERHIENGMPYQTVEDQLKADLILSNWGKISYGKLSEFIEGL
jgi:multidrug resistance efflux pump